MKTIEYRRNKIRIIDQTKLPTKLVYLDIDNIQALWWAIKKLKVRGAPAIGIAAALGVVLAANRSNSKTYQGLFRDIKKTISYLKKSRPTAVNLFWALERMQVKLNCSIDKNIA